MPRNCVSLHDIGGSEIKIYTQHFRGSFGLLKSGTRLISSPYPVIPRRVALQQSPLLFDRLQPFSQRQGLLSTAIFGNARLLCAFSMLLFEVQLTMLACWLL